MARTGALVEKVLTPTSGTGRSEASRAGRGFTLIELLVVIAILGILSTFVALSTAPDPRRGAAVEAERLGLRLEAALQEAQWGGHGIAWSADAKGYRFLQAESEWRWGPIIDDELLRLRRLPTGRAKSATGCSAAGWRRPGSPSISRAATGLRAGWSAATKARAACTLAGKKKSPA